MTVGGVRAPRVSAATKIEAERIAAQFKADMLAGRTPATCSPRRADHTAGHLQERRFEAPSLTAVGAFRFGNGVLGV